MTESANAVASAFVAARREARVLASYPGERPADLASAYQIQDRAISLDGRKVAGWKVGRIFPPDDIRLGSNRLAGPIFAESLRRADPGESPEMPIFAGGFAAVEAEMLLHVAAGWNGIVPSDDAGTRSLMDELWLGIEVASSPYPHINSDGPAVTASDFGNNAGLVIGPQLAGWRELDLCAIRVRMDVDDRQVGEATAAAMLDGPYGAVRFLLANLSARGIDASGGIWVSTGAITGVHKVVPGARVRAIFGGHGEVHCRITAARASQ
ncbi:MAG: 2-keto-4-pentenoate hydratase [Novosphingobium sp.]